MIIGSFTINTLSAISQETAKKTVLKCLKLSNSNPPVFIKQQRQNERLINTVAESKSLGSVFDGAQLTDMLPKDYTIKPTTAKRSRATGGKRALATTAEEIKVSGDGEIIVSTGSQLDLASVTPESSIRSKSKVKPKKKTVSKLPDVVGNLKYNDLKSYLNYARQSSLSTKTTVFQGNFYEMTFLEFLRRNFKVSRIIHQGGKNDKGIDILANWDPIANFETTEIENGKVMQPVEGGNRKVKPIVLKKGKQSKNVKLFVQCKCWTKSRIDAKMIREINGTFHNGNSGGAHGGPKPGSGNFLMVVTPTGFTRQGQIDFDSSLLPLVFIKFSKNELKKHKKDVYELNNYKLGKFESFYCNPMANALLKGLDWTHFMNLLVVNQKSVR
ncbi:unnamed protein product [Ambrosiozyma monospora]|uniref:Required for respiratory growth protein 7, mitochondrial n=1 Tax=Ambrosiozyma monospora TaxID=43982 RepID=A0A9W7DDA9_AMBMO|nr:unnamed protein product [Ambrosiozyma monospora]